MTQNSIDDDRDFDGYCTTCGEPLDSVDIMDGLSICPLCKLSEDEDEDRLSVVEAKDA